MLFPLSFGFEQGRVHFPHCGDGPVEASGKGLAGQFVKQGLGIEKIQVAGSALHEEKNDVFGLSPTMRNLGERRVRGSSGKQRFVGQRGKSDCSESCSCSGKEVPAVKGVADSIAGHAQWR